MTPEIEQEFTQFKIVAQRKIKAETSEHERNMIAYRLELLERRFNDYSNHGFGIDKVRELEKKRFLFLQSLGRKA